MANQASSLVNNISLFRTIISKDTLESLELKTFRNTQVLSGSKLSRLSIFPPLLELRKNTGN